MIVTLADLVGSATLVAVTTTVWLPKMFCGAVYRPLLDKTPIIGVIVQVTLGFALPATVAENCRL